MGIASAPIKSNNSGTTYYTETAADYLDVYGGFVHGLWPAKHHQEWIDRITALVEGRSEKRRLLVIAPPGHAKSSWISLIFPPWYLGNHPSQSLLFFTSSDTMARQFANVVKTTMEGNERHRLVFPDVKVRPNKVRGWSNDGLYLQGAPEGSKDPSYRGLGYGASVIGARAHGIVLDDPLSQEQAQSEVEQLKAKQYHDLTVDSRLHPDGWEIAIMTRWHENDLATHLMNSPDWDVLHMPAIGYWGEDTALWPERFDLAWLKTKRTAIGSALFSCSYQGDPSSLGGLIFRSGQWFRSLPSDFYERRDDGRCMLDRLTIIQFWDLAYSAKTSADYTVAVTIGVDSAYNIFVLNVFRKRIEEEALDKAMAEHILATRPRLLGVEETAFKQASVADLIRRVAKLLQGQLACAIQPVKPSADKVTRAMLPAARAEAGTVYADRQAPWWPTFESECLGFPLAAHDDQVDAFAGATLLALEKVRISQGPSSTPYTWGTGKQQQDDGWPWRTTPAQPARTQRLGWGPPHR